tara:strand:- start:8365 stop:9078 length:714 start_codon:yes stop_codon:yes gene_type:complete
MSNFSTAGVLGNVGTSGHGIDSTVFLEFASGNKDGDAAITNRIMLRCQSISITTNKNLNALPIPFSGLATGESRSFVIDLGIARKSVNLSNCIIHDQFVSKRYDDGTPINKAMTAFEIAQLIHSSIDGSFAQPDQNLNKLVVLYPSRVGRDYEYHTGVDETTPHEDLPLIPFTWASRTKDQTNTLNASDFPSATSTSSLHSIDSIKGYIDNFTTNFEAGGIVTCNINFQEAFNISVT